jgi:hypothetical protein
MDIDALHAKLIRCFIQDVLSKSMQRYVVKDFVKEKGKTNEKTLVCPLILGGTNLYRCASLSPSARSLVKKMRVNDIDIKFVMDKNCTRYKSIDEVDHIRRSFLREIFSPENPGLVQAISTATNGHEDVAVTFDTSYRFADPPKNDTKINPKSIMVRIMKLAYVDVIYTNIQSKQVIDRTRFMDTTLLCYDLNPSLYTKYIKAVKREAAASILDKASNLSHLPAVPTYIHKGVIYSSCMWTYIDTVYMIDVYATNLVDPTANETAKDQLYNLEHFVKYLVKFIIMYIQINKNISGDPVKLAKLRKVFNNSFKLHKKLADEKFEDMMLMRKDMSPQYAKLAWFYKQDLDKLTNIKYLQKLIKD